jgi:hypothetical protein
VALVVSAEVASVEVALEEVGDIINFGLLMLDVGLIKNSTLIIKHSSRQSNLLSMRLEN